MKETFRKDLYIPGQEVRPICYANGYGVATICRLLKIIGLFCKRALQKRRYSAKETSSFNEPTNRSHPIDLISQKTKMLKDSVCICENSN